MATRPTTVGIGERRRLDPGGRLGFIQVDSVHQGDRDCEEGPEEINLIDEVSQFEHVGAVRPSANQIMIDPQS